MGGWGLGADRRVKIARGGAMEQEGPVQMERTWGGQFHSFITPSIHRFTIKLFLFFFKKGNV